MSLQVVRDSSSLKTPSPGVIQHSLLFTTEESLISALNALKDESVDSAHLVGIIPNDNILISLFRVLKILAKMTVEGITTREAGQEVSTDMKIQGFSNVVAASDGGERFVVCQKPAMEVGASAPLQSTKSASTSAPVATWKMNTDDLAEDDLVEEDTLLNDGLSIQPMSCDPHGESKGGGKRRACKNCSCGLAELEASQASENKEDAIKQFKTSQNSGCGNCSKGDAFRCASCPFLGKPSFKPGQEKLILSVGDDI